MRPSRRDVLRGLGGLALTGLIGCDGDDGAAPPDAGDPPIGYRAIPALANRTIEIPGPIQAYAQNSVAAGETIDFHVHATVPTQLSIVRLGWDLDTPSRDWVVQTFPAAEASPQTIRPGSYVHVENALEPSSSISRLALEAWVRITGKHAQGVIGQLTRPHACGFALFVGDDGHPRYYFGDGEAYDPAYERSGPERLIHGAWHHLVAVFHEGHGRLFVDGAPVDEGDGFPAAVTPGHAPLRLGALGDATGTTHFLDGDLAMPVIYGDSLSAEEVRERHAHRPPRLPDHTAVIGCWPLTEESGPALSDLTGTRPGLIVNQATWMIGGPGFDAAAVPRDGSYDPDQDATRGHAIRLASDDLFDCAWPIRESFDIPLECPPGLYAGRVVGGDSTFDVTFVVRRPAARPAAGVLVLCATATWHAYNRSLGLFSLYHAHAGGQPTYHVGEAMPWPEANPYLLEGDPAYRYGHLVRAERFLHVWLEQQGIDYDTIGDRDLHGDPGVLASYRTVVIAGHSEYWSAEAYAGVAAYLAGGGNLVVASGNTMFWRVTYQDGRIECRKYPHTVGGFERASWGELYHEHDHQRGGLMREAGLPAWKLIGLECAGYGGEHVPYQVTDVGHDFFQTPEAVPVAEGDQLGGPYAIGHEWDVRLAMLPGTTPAIPAGYTPAALAQGRSAHARFDYHADWTGPPDGVISEIVDWQRPDGGRVFAIGSIAAGQALHADEHLGAVVRNALHHLGVVFRLEATAIDASGHLWSRRFDGATWDAAWQDRGGGFGAAASTAQAAQDDLALVAIDAGGRLACAEIAGGQWTWSDRADQLRGRPAIVGWGRGRVDVFARDLDGHLGQVARRGGKWSAWTDLALVASSDPSAASWQGNRLGVVALGSLGNVVYRWSVDGAWYPTQGWKDLGGQFVTAPTLHVWGGNRANVFAVVDDGRVFSRYWDGASWAPWQDLGGAVASRVHAASWGGDRFTLFAIDRGGRLRSKWWDGAAWGPDGAAWQDHGGALVGEPAVASYRGTHLAVMAAANDGTMQLLTWDGRAWSPWQSLGGSGLGTPALLRWV